MIYVDENKIRTSDVDSFDHLTYAAILDMFQDVAGIHASMLGLGFKELFEKNLYWVLAKTRITKYGNPKPFSKVYIKTWPLEKGKLDFVRNYMMYDENNVVIAKGSSQWCVIDADTRKITKTDFIKYPSECITDVIYEQKMGPIIPVNDQKIFTYLVGNKDLDHNGHMNNARYANLVMDAMSFEEINKYNDFQINYAHECKCGQKITLYRKDEEDKIYFTGLIDDSVVCFNAVVM